MGTNELVGMGRGVVVADVVDSPDIVARGMAVDTGPMRCGVCPAIRGVVGGGTTEGEGARAGGDDGTRGAGVPVSVVVPGKVVVPGSVVVPGLRVEAVGCLRRAARPN